MQRFERKLPVLRHTIAGVLATQFAAISERNGVSGFQPRLAFLAFDHHHPPIWGGD